METEYIRIYYHPGTSSNMRFEGTRHQMVLEYMCVSDMLSLHSDLLVWDV